MITTVSKPAKRPAIVTDWSHSCGAIVKDGKSVLPRARKVFQAEPLIRHQADWDTLREQVRQAERVRLSSGGESKDRLADFVPMLTNYKAQFEARARADFGECIFATATKTRDWTLRHPGEIARYVPGHGYFFRVLPKLAKYVRYNDADDKPLSWKGFKDWLAADLPGKKPENNHPPGTALARTGKSQLRVAVACYVPDCASEEVRRNAERAVAAECDTIPAVRELDDEDDEEDSETSLGEARGIVEMEEDGGGSDDSEDDALEPVALPEPRSRTELSPSDDEEEEEPEVVEAALLQTPLDVGALERKIRKETSRVAEDEKRVAVRKQNIQHMQDRLKDHFEAVGTRKRAREEELQGMEAETLVRSDGTTVDQTQEYRRVVAKYIRDLGTYADINAELTEYFASATRHRRVFTHERGKQVLPNGCIDDAGDCTAEVKHAYLAYCDKRKVVVVLSAKDESSYFNVGLTQLQLKRARTSLRDEFEGYTKFYHAAYSTSPPTYDLHEHTHLGQEVYTTKMTDDMKKLFFAPLKAALQGA